MVNSKLLVIALATCTFANTVVRQPLAAIYTLHNVTLHDTVAPTALSEFDLSFTLNTADQVKLSLEPNHNIFPPHGLSVSVLDQHGQSRQHTVDRLAHKVYKGQAWTRPDDASSWMPAGWTRIKLRDGLNNVFEGVFTVDGDAHHIQIARNYLQTRHVADPEADHLDHESMLMYRDSDMLHNHVKRFSDLDMGGNYSCSHDEIPFNVMAENPVHQAYNIQTMAGTSISSLFGKRDIDQSTGGNSAGISLVSTIGSTAGCPTTRKVALVGVAADCTYRSAFGSDNETEQNIITQMNTASALYENTFGFSLALANLTIANAECPTSPVEATFWNQACSDSFDIVARLNAFSAWRGTQNDSNSHWTLLSTCNTGAEVGLAWLGQACVRTATASNSTTGTNSSETVSGANVVIRAQGVTEWQVLAHETGHTWGAVHDCDSSACSNSQFVSSSQCCPLSSGTCSAGAQYIMNPSAMQGITAFSPCTVGNVCSAIGRNAVRSDCLSNNADVSTYSGPQCGNGIVEPGEDCDCGGTAGCAGDTCCDATTCKYTTGSVCDDRDSACCKSCQFATEGSVCRASSGACDPQEVCPGNSSVCPADVTAPDGQSCGANGLQCASGQCTSRDLQCQTIMSAYAADNSTSACGQSGCQLSCSSPSFGPNVCYGLNQNFLDGTSCGGDGKCSNGICKGETVAGEVKSWINDNKPLFIGIVATIGGLLLLLVVSCIWHCCRRRRVVKAPAGPPPGWTGPPPMMDYYGQPAPPPPPGVYMSGGQRGVRYG